MRRRIKRWLEKGREHRRHGTLDDLDADLKGAMRHHMASTRLVRIQAGRSAKALKRLSDLLAIRAKAIDSISTAEDALTALNKDRDDDK